MGQIDKQNQCVGINLIMSFISIQYLYRGRGKGGEERRERGCKINKINKINNIYNNINHLRSHFLHFVGWFKSNLIRRPVLGGPLGLLEASL